MTLFQQVLEALVRAPLSLVRLRRNSIVYLCVYLGSGLTIFALFSWFLIENQEIVKLAILDYLFPQSWQSISEFLGVYLFESQAKVVLSNLVLSGSLVAASIFLFPLKEKFSAEFEKEAGYGNGHTQEFTLIRQAWEEFKLLIFYVTAQSIILWIGYYPYDWANILSITLSYLFLFFAFAIDFVSPTLQRHGTAYTVILKVAFGKPLLALSFGLLFSLPALVLSRLIFTYEDLTFVEIVSALFLFNILLLALAVPAGTRVASVLLPEVNKTLAPKKKAVFWVFSGTSMTLIAMLFLHGKLIESLHHKSQLLKAEYSVDWSSFESSSSLSELLFGGKSLTDLTFDVEINNPTQYDIAIENSTIHVEKQAAVIANIALAGFEVPAGENKKITIKLDSDRVVGSLGELKDILEDWRVDLYLDLWPGIPFIVNIAK